ncbi:MAG TPA: OmpH family outer membrane protein [Phycisphaerae bacterium]|nr:OmpH family outer membrane protein [Phycisphaerae bacterium]
MGQRRMLWMAAVAAVVALGIAAPAGAEMKIGSVDIVEVMNNYERTKDANADLQVEEANLKAAAEPRVREVSEFRLRRDGFNKGSEEWRRLDDEAIQKEMEVRTWLAVEQAKIERRHQEILLDMYREIEKVAGRVAQAKGVDLVFTKAFLSPPQIDLEDSQGLEDLKNRIVSQRLLYPSAVADLTPEVLKRLNEGYQAAKKPAPAAEGAPPKE